MPVINGNFSDNTGGYNSTVKSPLGWTVVPALDGSFFFFGDYYDEGNVGFTFGATDDDLDVISQDIDVEQGCKYEVLYTVISFTDFPAGNDTMPPDNNEFLPAINNSTLLDAQGMSLEEVNLPFDTTNNYVGVFTAEANVVTLSFGGRNQPSYDILGNVAVNAL